MKILIKNAYLITLTEEYGVIPNGYLYINNNIIEKLGEGDFSGEDSMDRVIDAQHQVVAPGLVNAHMHCYSTYARGMDIKASPSCFIEILEKLWWKLDKTLTKDNLYLSTIVPIMEGIRSGVTTFIDHHASPNCVPGCLDELEKAFEDAGMRSVLCYEVSDRDGQEISDQGIEENIRFCKKANSKENGLVKGMFGLHASFTVNDSTIKKSVEAAKELNVGLHLHVAEGQADQTLTLYKNKKRVVKRLFDTGVLGPKSIAVHAIAIDDEEKELLAKTGTWTIHNPRSNMNNSVGIMDLLGLLSKGVKVCLGTDGMSGSLWPDIRTAALIHKHELKNPRVVWNELLTLLSNNYKLANMFFHKPVGKLKPGYLADVVQYNYFPPTLLTNDNFLGHLLFGFSHVNARTVIINGKIVLDNYQFINLDEFVLTQKASSDASTLWKKF